MTIDEYLALRGITDLTEEDKKAIAQAVIGATVYGNGHLQRLDTGRMLAIDPRAIRIVVESEHGPEQTVGRVRQAEALRQDRNPQQQPSG